MALQRPYPWQTSGTTVEVQTDGTVRGVAPGAYSVVGEHADGKDVDESVVLPAGWTMRLEPQDLRIDVGQSVRYRVRVLGPALEPLDGVPFSLFPPAEEDQVRMSGLADHRWVEYTATAPGHKTITGYVGDHSVTTSLTVVEATARDR